jgi:hypothetical protein
MVFKKVQKCKKIVVFNNFQASEILPLFLENFHQKFSSFGIFRKPYDFPLFLQ